MNRPVGFSAWPHGQRLVDPAKGKPVRLERRPGPPNPRDDEQVHQCLESEARPWSLDPCCDAGGLSLRPKEAGFSIVATADSDATALESHTQETKRLTWLGDMSDPVEPANQMNGGDMT